MKPADINTDRLVLVPFEVATVEASLKSNTDLSTSLDCFVPAQWPPKDLADVLSFFKSKLEENPANCGWWGWFVLLAEPRTLIGSAGCSPFGPNGKHMFGYGILPAYWNQGYGTECAMALVRWVFEHSDVLQIYANTFEDHVASRKILSSCGFECLGISPNDAHASDEDRQGRGKLFEFVRRR